MKNKFLMKFTVVAAVIGLFSPSVNINTNDKAMDRYNFSPLNLHVSLLNNAEARTITATTPTRKKPANRPANKNVNINVNKNVNVNSRYYGGHHHGHHHGHYGYYHGHPILAWTTAIAIGSMVAASTMPKTCTTVVYNNISYKKCENTYYQPFYEGDTLVYKAVKPPY